MPPCWARSVPAPAIVDGQPQTLLGVPHGFLRNPRKEIAQHLEQHMLDIYPATTTYVKGLTAEIDIVSLPHRGLSWTSNITDPQKRTLIRIITGQVFNFKLLSRYTSGKVPPLCPLCHQLDSTSHIVCGGCRDPRMHRRVLHRHDEAVRTLLLAVLKGRMGRHFILADVTLSDPACDPDCNTANIDVISHGRAAVPKRLPVHLLAALHARLRRAVLLVSSTDSAPLSADTLICTLLHEILGEPDEPLSVFLARLDVDTVPFRPDLAVFVQRPRSRCPSFASTDWTNPLWRGYEGARIVHIVELGYVREGFAAAKQLQKRSQHRLLEMLLRDLGWTVHYHTATLGVAGTVYCDLVNCMTALGVPPSAAATVLTSIVRGTLNLTHGLVLQRRDLDSRLITLAFHKPP